MQQDLFKQHEVSALDIKRTSSTNIVNRNFQYSRSKPLDVLSLGYGMQSTCLAFMAGMDMIPRPDFAIFSDTKAEPEHLYRYISEAKEQLLRLNINVLEVSKGDLYNDVMYQIVKDGFIEIPLYFLDEKGTRKVLGRRCTTDYKIETISKKVRELTSRQRLPNHSVRMWLGITIDERRRLKPIFGQKRFKYRQILYPFFAQIAKQTYPDFDWSSVFGNIGFTRNDCINFFKSNNLTVPPKSSCFFCPFHGNKYWKFLKEESVKEFDKAVFIDESVRDMNIKGFEKRTFYLHPSCKPLRSVNFDSTIINNSMFGSCNSGHCFT